MRFLDQLDQRQTRIGLLNVVAQIGTRQLETRGTVLRRFNNVVLEKRRLPAERLSQVARRLDEIAKDPGGAERLSHHVRSPIAPPMPGGSWVHAWQEWIAEPELPSPLLRLDEDRTGVYLDLARQLGLLSGSYGLTELGTVLQSIQPASKNTNPLAIGSRPRERALFTLILLLGDVVAPFFLAEMFANRDTVAGNQRTDLACLRDAVKKVKDGARNGASISQARGVRDLKAYLDRLESDNAAWHNTRPRIEFLIDLGLVDVKQKAQHHHILSEAGERAVEAWRPLLEDPKGIPHVLDSGFMHAYANTHALGLTPMTSPESRLRWLAQEFRPPIARAIGYTPARSVAIAASLAALSDGFVVEVGELLQTLRDSAHGPLARFLSFSGGSRLDGEFLIRIDPGLADNLTD